MKPRPTITPEMSPLPSAPSSPPPPQPPPPPPPPIAPTRRRAAADRPAQRRTACSGHWMPPLSEMDRSGRAAASSFTTP
eukprot:scaffold17755_cov129-Isochrysis_galbana.AAC.4